MIVIKVGQPDESDDNDEQPDEPEDNDEQPDEPEDDGDTDSAQ